MDKPVEIKGENPLLKERTKRKREERKGKEIKPNNRVEPGIRPKTGKGFLFRLPQWTRRGNGEGTK